MTTDTVYIIDTDVWINLNKNYSRHVFPGLWTKIVELIGKDRIAASTQVWDEISRGHDELVDWFRIHKRIFHNTDSMMGQVQKIIKKHPHLTNPDTPYDPADPYLIALAMRYKDDISGLTPIIVTEENAQKPSRIPYAARDNGVSTCKLLGMIQREGWTF